jgi:DNA-binding FrmR family transcriptional regulator
MPLRSAGGMMAKECFHTHTRIDQEPAMSRLVDIDKKKALCARLARVEGQLRGLQKLIDEDADCEKIAQQMAAARKALDKSFFTMVGCMIEQGDQSADRVADMLTRFA